MLKFMTNEELFLRLQKDYAAADKVLNYGIIEVVLETLLKLRQELLRDEGKEAYVLLSQVTKMIDQILDKHYGN